ncbi:MAG: glycosyltransferase [Pseudomonadota bacterium]
MSIIIVNMNGARHLGKLFASLEAQTYKKFEVVFVDNASSDESLSLVDQSSLPIVTIKNDDNKGFAEANNQGAAAARGELIVLLNNDTTLDMNCIQELVQTHQHHSDAAAVAPKILFMKPFVPVSLHCEEDFVFEYERTLSEFEYKKIFIGSQHKKSKMIRVEAGSLLKLLIPQCEAFKLYAHSASSFDCYLRVSLKGVKPNDVLLSTLGGEPIEVNVPKNCRDNAAWVINNAGSFERNDGTLFDRGYGTIDVGQFDSVEHIPMFCGCCVAIKRSALERDKLFVSDFFAYYEDSELSLRLTRRGYSIVYQPAAILHHYHASTSIETSGFWRVLTTRNRIMFDLVCNGYDEKYLNSQIAHINHLKNFYLSDENATDSEKYVAEQADSIVEDLRAFGARVKANEQLVARDHVRIGVYNTYWNSRGGGETHALMIALVLSEFGQVDLISEIEFDKDALGEYLGMDLSKLNARKIWDIYEGIGREYDIFVNSTYLSTQVVDCPNGLYAVSFPFRDASTTFRRAYHFLTNSEFTQSWIERWWGKDVKSTVVYPAVRNSLILSNRNREPWIVSLGRFTPTGHSKKQLEMVEAFRQLLERCPEAWNWRLKLMGSVDLQNPRNSKYLEDVQRAAADLPVDVMPNAEMSVVQNILSTSAIYWHLTGLGEDIERNPEKFEHFGIAVIEAISSGCWPIVIDAAGPKEIVDILQYGDTVGTVSELTDKTAERICLWGDPEGWEITKPDLSIFERNKQTDTLRRIASEALANEGKNVSRQRCIEKHDA